MSPDEQRIAIARACGWTDIRRQRLYEGLWGNKLIGSDNCRNRLPDYLNDLNAMHEAEKVLTPKYQPAKGESQWGDYLGWIGFCGENKIREVYECVTATAAQRAQAFLRTLGLWQESSTPTQPQ
jgi:hypothetical protein